MNKKFKTATVLTITVMIVYSVIYAVMQNNGTLPRETEFYLVNPEWVVPLAFSVSFWWGLLFFPASLMLIGVYTSYDLYVGQEPRSANFSHRIKHQARILRLLLPAIAIGIGMATGMICILVNPFVSGVGGPLSALVSVGLVAAGSYLLFGVTVTASTIFTIDLSYYDANDDYKQKMHSLTETYLQLSAQVLKSGFLLGMPLWFGCVLGYMMRSVAHVLIVTVKILLSSEKSAV